MIKKILSVFIISLGMLGALFAQPVFDPKKDGWYFSNWAEQATHCIRSCDFSWDLFRKTYLGV
ncbi:MAG: hypothetical protein ACUVR0_09070 [Candidatus Aminicenantales bacterium]